jgi:hypothetical protein
MRLRQAFGRTGSRRSLEGHGHRSREGNVTGDLIGRARLAGANCLEYAISVTEEEP